MSSEKDLQVLGEDYYNSLKELTFNSRPIITTLTILAQENIPAAKYITNAIVKRINKCVPGQKLYALYLMDSICKNIGSPYSVLFSQNLSSLFIETYTLVDEPQRKKMIDLFNTWKVARSTSGLPLFPPEPLLVIDKFLTKVAGSTPPSRHMSLTPSGPANPTSFKVPSAPTSSSLISNIDKLQSIISSRVANSQSDANSTQKLNILSQLKTILSTQTLSPSELASIQSQLKGITENEMNSIKKNAATNNIQTGANNGLLKNLNNIASNSVPTNSTPTNAVINPATFLQQLLNSARPFLVHSSNNNNPGIHVPSNVNPQGASNPLSILSNLNNIAALNGNAQKLYASINNASQGSSSQAPAKPIDINTLFHTLQSTGIIKNNAVPPTKPPTGTNNGQSKVKPIINLPSTSILQNILYNTKGALAGSETSNEYSVDYSDFQLTNALIASKVPDIKKCQKMLFEKKPIKCNNCGKRFTSKDVSQRHLDWHFRVNKRLKDSASMNTRSLYLTFDNFCTFKESEILGDGDLNAHDGSKSSGSAASNQIFDSDPVNDNPDSHYIVIPDDCIDMTTLCNVCKDTLKGVWNDEKGEWIWNNAVSVNNKIYHWTCYHETQRNKNKDIELSSKRKLESDETQANAKKPNINGLNLNLDILKSLNLVKLPGQENKSL